MSSSTVALRAGLLALRDLIDANGGGALWLFTDEPMAVSPEAAPVGAPAAIIVLDPVSFVMHATAASMTCTAVGNASVSGSVTWGRFVDGSGTGVDDRTAGPPGSGAQIIVTDREPVPSAVIWSGGEIAVEYTMTAG